MAEITLNYDDSLRIVNDKDADPGAKAIAACFIALSTTTDSDQFDSATRSIVLKLSHMIASAIYNED